MLARLRGGRAGIRAYLETGQKAGRDYTRDELDERVPLYGDLELVDQVINAIEGDGQKYLHVTLGFREPEVSHEILEDVVERFRKFALSAYEEDEYLLYAEAHLPRLKAFRHARTGESVERLPHIHIVVPARNLRSWTRLDPFGLGSAHLEYINAWQTVTNAELGLEGPEYHPRLQLQQGAAEVLARVKGDLFSRAGELKAEILQVALQEDVRDLNGLMQAASRQGAVKLGRGRDGDYVTVKPPGAQKAIRLKDKVFREAFLKLELDAKLKALDPETPESERLAMRPTRSLVDERELLQHWHRQRAREVRYLSGGPRRKAYREANESDRAAMLDRFERSFRKNYPAVEVALALPEPSLAVRSAVNLEDDKIYELLRPDAPEQLLSPGEWFNRQHDGRLQWRSWMRELEGLYVERTADEWQAYRFLRTVGDLLESRERGPKASIKPRQREVADRVLAELGHRHGFPQSLRSGGLRLGGESRRDGVGPAWAAASASRRAEGGRRRRGRPCRAGRARRRARGAWCPDRSAAGGPAG